MTRASSDNLFGFSDFIVDALDAKGSYITVQSAVTAAILAGGNQKIFVKQGSIPYAESVTVPSGATLEIIGVGSNAQNGIGVEIDGNFSILGAIVSLSNLYLKTVAGIALTIDDSVALTSTVNISDCRVFSTDTTGVSISNTNAHFPTMTCKDSTFSGTTGSGLLVNTGVFITLENVIMTSTAAEGCLSNGNATSKNCEFSGITNAFHLPQGAWIDYGSLFSCGPTSPIQIDAATLTTIGSSIINLSGSFAVAGTGTLNYADLTLRGLTVTFDPLIIATPLDWKPYSTAGNTGTAVRGTSGFDSTNFVLTNGFVQLDGSTVGSTITGDSGGPLSPTSGNWNIVGGPGVTTVGAGDTLTINSVLWTSQGGSLTVSADSGTFDISGGAATFTLPAAPNQGEECRFVCINSGGVVKANGGQAITIGSTTSGAGGTATSTQGGDTLYLTFNADTLRWFSIATTGTWIVV